MEWEDRQESSNVEDRRGLGAGAVGGIAAGGGGLLILILGLILGVDPGKLSDIVGHPERERPARSNKQADPAEDRLYKFASVILHDTEVVWEKQFDARGLKYRKPKMVVYRGAVDTACGHATSRVGPFYCPGDQKVYLDLGFFEELERKLGAPGEFARAYVIAHEVGHHVQNLLGYSARADQTRGTAREKESSVRLELQADYLAGVWAHYVQQKYADKYKVLNQADIKSGLNAAQKIGDDYLQKRATGTVRPESFTHGTSKAREHWLGDGMRTGDFSKAKLDTFFTQPITEVDVGQRGR
jgi:predicted metalloprotease